MLGKYLIPEKPKYFSISNNRRTASNKLSDLAEDFLYGGSSALLLLFINLFDSYWFLCFVALLPLIVRLSRASEFSAVRTGILFGFCYLLTVSLNSIPAAPLLTFLKISAGLVLILILSWLTAWIRKRSGFNPLFLAVFWAFLDYGLDSLGITPGILGRISLSVPIFGAISTLFGFVIVSFIIVLANSLLLLAIEKIAGLTTIARKDFPAEAFAWRILLHKCGYSKILNFVPEVRGPPFP
ncbi:MAG: hypothetical protein AB1746_07835 [Candidatus Zixiibacteriota bacterium]